MRITRFCVRINLDYDRFEVKNHFLGRIVWKEGSTEKIVKIYDDSAHQWNRIGTELGLERGALQGIGRDNYDDYGRVTTVLGRWYDNANNLQMWLPQTWLI